ncbi:MAG: sporulation protein YabP [Firmicutes bacterium]|nr:sporulation protein YabP [Bacillota bacterium]
MEQRHTLTIDDRQSLEVTDVKDVGSFSEEEVLMTLSEGGLVIKGEGLHMVQLDLEEGRAVLSGRVHSLVYTQKHGNMGSLWKRLWK